MGHGHTPTVVRNAALVFIKPHAITEKTIALVKSHLESKGLEVVKDGRIEAATIDKNMLIDQHYYAIASKATILTPDKLPVPADKFKDTFGLEWSEALASGKAINAKQACEKLNLDASGLGKRWLEAKDKKLLVKFGGGFYCGKIDDWYVFNGFFMEMRNKYVAPGAAIHYFLAEWDPLDLSWTDFRGLVLGPTDPEQAPEDSLRGQIFSRWEDLGLSSKPNVGDNGVHASASPFEALSERMNWLGIKAEEDAFGQLLLHGGVTPGHIKDWALDPQVTYLSQGAQVKSSLYDALEDMDADRCLTQCQLIVGDAAGSVGKKTREEAIQLHDTGNILGKTIVDGYDSYSIKYFVEDPKNAGPIWEVTREQAKQDGEMAQETMWSARMLSDAEAQKVFSSGAASRRSPLTNRVP